LLQLAGTWALRTANADSSASKNTTHGMVFEKLMMQLSPYAYIQQGSALLRVLLKQRGGHLLTAGSRRQRSTGVVL
jgi:hypothetical protein